MAKKVAGVIGTIISALLLIFVIFLFMPAIEEALQPKFGVLASVYCGYIFSAICFYIANGVLFGFITDAISESKGYSNGFWWGFFLGLLGMIVVAVRPNQRKPVQDKSVKAANYTQALERLASMRDQGILTEAEFNEKKHEILKRI